MVVRSQYPGWRYATQYLHLRHTEKDVIQKVKEVRQGSLVTILDNVKTFRCVSLSLCSHVHCQQCQKASNFNLRKTTEALSRRNVVPWRFCLCAECCSCGGFWSAQPHADAPILSVHVPSYSYAEQKQISDLKGCQEQVAWRIMSFKTAWF